MLSSITELTGKTAQAALKMIKNKSPSMHATLNMIKTKSTLEVCNFATTKQSPIFIAGVNKLTTNNSNIQEMNSGTPPVSPYKFKNLLRI